MKIKLFLLFIFLILFSFIAYAATLTVNYNATNAELCKKFCVYKNVGSEYTVGLGSPTAKNISDGMSLTATITDANDDMYIILTKPNLNANILVCMLTDIFEGLIKLIYPKKCLACNAKILENEVEKKVIREVLEGLLAEYGEMERSFQLVEVSGGYQFRTKTEYAPWIHKLRKVRPIKLSQPALETLAIVAYRQPIVRSEIEQIRGVDSGWVLHSLLEKGIIKILGRKEVPGRPLVYGTTRRFLEIFGLRDLSGLPTLQELESLKGER